MLIGCSLLVAISIRTDVLVYLKSLIIGAVLGLVGYICYKVPDGKLSIAFLPQYSFSAKSGVIGMAVFDTAGLILGVVTKWKYMIFDHAAHLSGLLFGL